jgi:Flp pilus assembly protein TadG
VNSHGTVSLELLIILVPVIFGLMGFAVDLGRLYLIRGELKTAADAMALAAAQKLIGTDAALESATAAARTIANTESGFGNRYNFGGMTIGQTSGFLNSEIPDPSYFATAADATGSGEGGESASTAGGTTAKYARVTLTAEAPLLFWSFLPLGAERKTPVQAQAVAGISAPLCTACGIEPLAIAPIDSEDTTDFGFVVNTKYTFSYVCNGTPTPSPIAGTLVPFLLIDRFNPEAQVFPDENTQLYQLGAQGLLPSTNPARSCVQINSAEGEQVWAAVNGGSSAAPLSCNQNPPSPVTSFLCGVASRFESILLDACTSVPEVDSLMAYLPDTDIADLDDYAGYTGNGRRLITVAIVDALAGSGVMNVQAFRQFLIEPNPEGNNINPADNDGRFVALYIGSVAPLRQGRFDGCQLAAGPGKVVLHQ